MDTLYDNGDIKEKVIRGKALYFGTSQVADMLNISASKTRYYTDVFDEILHIEISNKQRRYTQTDIDKMKFMIELKEEGMTIKQIQEYCQEVDFEDSKEIQIKESNPLSVQTMAKALLEQQATLIEEMKKEIIDNMVREGKNNLQEQNEQFNNMRTNLSNDVAITVEDGLERINKKIEERDISLVDTLRETLKDDKIKALELEISELKLKQGSKSLFSKIFNFKK